jgi:hypothetical protein
MTSDRNVLLSRGLAMSKEDRKQRKKKQRQDRLRREKHLRHFGGGAAFETDREISEWYPVNVADTNEQFRRIDAILGDSGERDLGAAVQVYFQYLKKSLVLPCEVTGSEDFRWEEYYVIGPGRKAEHDRLRKQQPSYMDHYELLGIELGEVSEWMLFSGDDIAAHVRRLSDNKEFVLGLAELEAVDHASPNFQLLNDYAVFLVNNR